MSNSNGSEINSIENTNVSSPPPHQVRSHSIPQHIRIRNRRKRYLEANPSYFGPSLESADPLLYDRLIRTHQTEVERTSERATKGFAGTLEADLLRSEAKLDEVRGQQASQHVSALNLNPNSGRSASLADSKDQRTTTNGTHSGNSRTDNDDDHNEHNDNSTLLMPLPTLPHDFTSLTRPEAQQYWTELMTQRFLAGEDTDFDYAAIDGDEKWDDVRGEERDREEDWFDQEEEVFMDENEGYSDRGEDREGGTVVEGKGRKLVGETGVQDF